MSQTLVQETKNNNNVYSMDTESRNVLDPFLNSGHEGATILHYSKTSGFVKIRELIPKFILNGSPAKQAIVNVKFKGKPDLYKIAGRALVILNQRLFNQRESYRFFMTMAKPHPDFDAIAQYENRDHWNTNARGDRPGVDVINYVINGYLPQLNIQSISLADNSTAFILSTGFDQDRVKKLLSLFDKSEQLCKLYRSVVKDYPFVPTGDPAYAKLTELIKTLNIASDVMTKSFIDATLDAIEDVSGEVVDEYFSDSWGLYGTFMDHNDRTWNHYFNICKPDGLVVSFVDSESDKHVVAKLKEEIEFFPGTTKLSTVKDKISEYFLYDEELYEAGK